MDLIAFSNYQFNPQAIPIFIVGFLMIASGYYVYFKNKQALVNKRFLYICLSVSIWLLPTALGYSTKNENLAILWFKIDNFSVVFISINVYMFIKSFLGKSTSVIDKWGYFFLISYSLFAFLSKHLITGVHKYYWGFFPKWGIAGIGLLIIFFGYMLASFALLLVNYSRIDSSIKKNQARYIFLGFAFAYTGSVDFLPTYGIQIYPFGFLSIAIFLSIIGFTIVKHGLMDIEVIIRRTAVFAGLFAFVYGTFTVVTVIGQEFFKNFLHWNQWIAMIPTVAIITFALRPLEILLTNMTEKFLFQKKYDYRELLKTFTQDTLQVLELNKLTSQTVESLVKIVKLESAAVLLHNKDTKLYKMVAGMGIKEKEIAFKENDLIVSYLKKTNQHILKDKSADKIEGDGELKDSFKRLNARLCLPIELHDNLIGILSLGMKKSGEDFTQEDIDILNTLARTEAIAISNAQQFEENAKIQAVAAQNEKMAVIGTLAAGINHEICNPLGIVRGQCEMFLLNSRDGFYNEKSSEDLLKISSEIMNKVIKETDRATAITKKLSSFAKPSKRSEIEEVQVEEEMDEVLELLGHDLKLNNIDIQKDFPHTFPIILGDKKQIQEVLFNIIRNAAQAMDKKEGKIVVSGFADNGNVVVRIVDNGSGIPADKLGQIFNPFYTTKAPGKGTGLGLFIVKQVVEKNKGTISLESEFGVGTTFTLRFPAATTLVAAA